MLIYPSITRCMVLALSALAGCGADVAGGAATVGGLQVQSASQAKAEQAQILKKLNEAQAATEARAASAADAGN